MRSPSRVCLVAWLALTLAASGAMAAREHRKLTDEVTIPAGILPEVWLQEGTPFDDGATGVRAGLHWRGAEVVLQAESHGARRLEVRIHRAELGDHRAWEHFQLPTEPEGEAVWSRTVSSVHEVAAAWDQVLARFRRKPTAFLNSWLRNRRNDRGSRRDHLTYGFDWSRLAVPDREIDGVQHGVSPANYTSWYTRRHDDPLNPRGYGNDDDGYRERPWVSLAPAYKLHFEQEVELPGPGCYVVVARTEHGTQKASFLYSGLAAVARRDGDRIHLQVVEREDGDPVGDVEVMAHWVGQAVSKDLGAALKKKLKLARRIGDGDWVSKLRRELASLGLGGGTGREVTYRERTTDGGGRLVLDVEEDSRSGWLLLKHGEHLLPLSTSGDTDAVESLEKARRDPLEQGGRVLVHLTTDRQVYKPGETIRFRGVARRVLEGTELGVLAETEVKVMLGWAWQHQGGEVLLETGELGTFHGELKLEKDQRTGTFPLRAELPAVGGQGSLNLTVLAYRKPEHEVVVEPSADWYVQGSEGSFEAHGRFTVGGNLSDAKARWQLSSVPASRTPKGQPAGFTWRQPGHGGGVSGSGDGVLDDRGRIRIPVRVPRSEHDHDVKVAVTVISPDGREVHDEARFYAPRAEVAVGLKSTMSLVDEDEPWVVTARTVRLVHEEGGARSAAVQPREVELTLQRRRWERQPRGGSREVIDHIRTWTARTDARGDTEWRVPVPLAGNIELIARTEDDRGRETSSRISTYRFGKDAPWFRWDRIELSPDRDEYRPGETARVLVRCPLETGTAWWSLEGSGLRLHGSVPVRGYNALVKVPLTRADRPVAKLHVEMVEHGRKLMKEIDLKVPAEEFRAEVDIATDQQVYEPGSEVRVDLEVQTGTGDGYQGELCLTVVDEALEQVAPDNTPAPYPFFFGSRQNRVRGLGGSSHAYGMPLGGRGHGRMLMKSSAPQAAMAMADGAVPAPAPEASARAPGGAGGGGKIRVRSDFRDVAHWVGSVRTDAQGRAQLRFRLPDDLSRWRLVAYAVDGRTRVGKGEHRIVARKDLMVRLGLPRFLTSGDHVIVKSSVQNVSHQDRRGALTFQVDGARPVPLGAEDLALLDVRERSPGGWLFTPDGPVKRAPDRYELTVPAQGHDAVDFPLYAWGYPDSGVLTIQSTFDAGGKGDALRKEIPVIPFGRRVTEVEVRKVAPAAVLDVKARPGTYENATFVDLDLMMSLKHGVETALVDDLEQLVSYRYGCTEQTLSRFVPLAVARARLGGEWLREAGLEADLEPILEKGVERLRKLRNGDGWGWGPGDSPLSTITAYVISRVERMKDPYRTKLREELDLPRAVRWLRGLYDANSEAALDREEKERYAYRQLAVYRVFEALSLAGEDVKPPRTTRMAELEEDPRFWTAYGAGYLARATRAGGGTSDLDAASRAAARLGALSVGNQALRTWKHRGLRYSWYADDTETAALVLEFLQELEAAGRSTGDWFEPGLRWMVFGDGATHYRSTKARAVAAAVAARYLEGSPADPSRRPATVAVRTDRVQRAVVPADPRRRRPRVHVAAPELVRAGGKVRLEREQGPDVLARVDVTRYRKGPFQPEDNGFSVRSRMVADGDPHPSHEAITRVVEFRVPEHRRYALLEVPLLSGGEVPTEGEHRPMLYRRSDRGGWHRTWPDVDVLDDRVVYYFDWLSAGEYRAEVTMTPEVAGFHNMLPVRLFLMYFPHVEGTSESHRVAIGRQDD